MNTRNKFDQWVVGSVHKGDMFRVTDYSAKAVMDDLISPNGDIYSRGDLVKTLSPITDLGTLNESPKEDVAPEPEVVSQPDVETVEDDSSADKGSDSDVAIMETADVPAEVDVESMSKNELEEYGRSLGIELDKRKSRTNMIHELKAAMA